MSQQINLFNPIFLKQKKVFTTVSMAKALGVLVAGALALALYGGQHVTVLEREAAAGSAQLAAREASLNQAKTEFVPRQKSAQLALEVATVEAELKALNEVSAAMARKGFGDTNGYSEYFRAMARQKVGGVWLTGLAITGAGGEIAVQGRSLEAALVPNLIKRLSSEPVMQGKTFESLQISQPVRQMPAGADGKSVTQPLPYVEFNLLSSAAPDGAGVRR